VGVGSFPPQERAEGGGYIGRKRTPCAYVFSLTFIYPRPILSTVANNKRWKGGVGDDQRTGTI